MSYLHDSCKRRMCDECQDMSSEYEMLLRNYKAANSLLEARVEKLKQELEITHAAAIHWEHIAKLGYPDIIQQWMDSLKEKRQ